MLGWVLTMHAWLSKIFLFENRRDTLARPSNRFEKYIATKAVEVVDLLRKLVREDIKKIVVIEARKEFGIYIATTEGIVIIIAKESGEPLAEIYSH